MFSFFKKKPIKKPEIKLAEGSLYTGCSLQLLISHDKNVKVVVDWPTPKNQGEALSICENMSNLVIKMFNKDMYQFIIPVIKSTAIGKGEEFLLPTMFGMMESTASQIAQKEVEEKDEPIIGPLEMFKVRG